MQIGNIEWHCASCSASVSYAGDPVAESTRLCVSSIYDPPNMTWGDHLEQLEEESTVGK